MQNCLQTKNQSVYQHGISVRDRTFELIHILETNEIIGNWKFPAWLLEYRTQILQHLLPKEIIEEYTIFHDCGKPYCLVIDEEGKRHFPNHAQVSFDTWNSIGGNSQAAELMLMDMTIHTMKAADIDAFIKNPEAITLLIVGLAEVHSNGELFGGFESDSFKIKWNQINKRGKMICQKLFN